MRSCQVDPIEYISTVLQTWIIQIRYSTTTTYSTYLYLYIQQSYNIHGTQENQKQTCYSRRLPTLWTCRPLLQPLPQR